VRSSIGRKVVWFHVIIAAALGMFISFDLAVQQLKVKSTEKTPLEWACSSFEHSDCAKVSESDWGRFPFGAAEGQLSIPTAQLGLYFFTFVFCWGLIVGTTSFSRRWVHLFYTGLTAIGVGFSIYLEYVMWVVLDYWCPLCLASHVAGLIVFIGALLVWPRWEAPELILDPVEQSDDEPSGQDVPSPVPQASVTTDHWPDWRTLVLAPIIVLLVISSEHLYFNLRIQARQLELEKYYKNTYKNYLTRYNKWQHSWVDWSITKPVDIPLQGEPVRGPANARHRVVIYSDFLCPACRRFEEMFSERILPESKKYGGIKVTFKNWPISSECNPTDQRDTHPNACKPAYAIEAVRIIGGDNAFWKMHDLLWEHYDEMKEAENVVPILQDLAQKVGVDVDTFTKTMNSQEVKDLVVASIEEGMTLGDDLLKAGTIKESDHKWIKVNSTPAVFIDGKRMNSWGHITAWKRILMAPPPKKMTSKPTTRPSR